VGAGWVWPSVVPHGIIMGIQWMVGWTGGFLCPLPHLLYPLWIDWPRHLFRELHNWIRTFVVARKSDAWLGPIIFLLQTHASISLVASTSALVYYYCTCLNTRPLGLCAGYRTRMFLPQPHNTAARKEVQEW
jgi:hypothetical protein